MSTIVPRWSVLLLLGALVACAGSPPSAQQSADRAACQSQADQEFAIRHRSSLFQPNNSFSPYAAASPNLDQTRELADRFSHHRMMQECLRGASGPAPIGATSTQAP